jgi:NAD-reducing hydrogenase small subunit
MSNPRKRIGTTWLAGCSGCHMSLLDIDERILDLAKVADIVKCPIVDTKEFPPVDIALVEGAAASDQHLDEIRHIRRQAKILVSFGDCAVTGNVSALRNCYPKDYVLKHSYVDMISNENGYVPKDPVLQKLTDRVQPLHEVVKVDYYLGGCPPSADLIFHVLFELINDRVPNPGAENLIKYG